MRQLIHSQQRLNSLGQEVRIRNAPKSAGHCRETESSQKGTRPAKQRCRILDNPKGWEFGRLGKTASAAVTGCPLELDCSIAIRIRWEQKAPSPLPTEGGGWRGTASHPSSDQAQPSSAGSGSSDHNPR